MHGALTGHFIGSVTRRVRDGLVPPPPKKSQVRAGPKGRPFCCPQVYATRRWPSRANGSKRSASTTTASTLLQRWRLPARILRSSSRRPVASTALSMTSPRSERRCTSRNGRCAGSRRRVGTAGRSGVAERFGGRCDGCQRTVAPVAPSRILCRRRQGDVRSAFSRRVPLRRYAGCDKETSRPWPVRPRRPPLGVGEASGSSGRRGLGRGQSRPPALSVHFVSRGRERSTR